MTEALDLYWARPWFLILVPVALALGAVLVRTARGLGDWERAMDAELLATLRKLGRVTGGAPVRAWLQAVILAVLGLALAGPGVERRDTAGFRNLDAVVLVFDLSPSMVERPEFFQALTAARVLVDNAGTRQTGLIVYAGEAYVAAPLTTDPRAMDGMLALIDAQTMPVQGTAPEAGLALAETMLQQAQILAADVVLITDGGGLGDAAVAVAQRLAGRGAPVSALTFNVTPELDALVRAGQGGVSQVSDPFALGRRISERVATRLAETDFAMLVILDLGRWLLIPALIGAVFLLPRRRRA